MKLKIQTLTGEVTELQVDPESTVNQLKAEIHKAKKIKGAVLILKGKEILADGSTLVQCNIQDGEILNIVIEPPKQITVEVTTSQLRSYNFKLKVSNDTTVGEFKELIFRQNEICFLPREIVLELGGTSVVLSDASLPLSSYGVEGGSILNLQSPVMVVKFINQGGTTLLKQFPRSSTILEVKNAIMKYCCDSSVHDISMFRKSDDLFLKLDEQIDTPLGEIDLVYEETLIYFIEDKFYSGSCGIANVYGEKIGEVGCDFKKDTILSVKLRIQDQFGIPAKKITTTMTAMGSYANAYDCGISDTYVVEGPEHAQFCVEQEVFNQIQHHPYHLHLRFSGMHPM